VSYFRAVIIECDGEGCDTQTDGDEEMWFTSVRLLRAWAYGHGWTYSQRLGDLCPECRRAKAASR
jgi:hypothetical protein